jgi:cytochrome c biogenesis protein CcmG/thiol:disulfide interchange protein DsbE
MNTRWRPAASLRWCARSGAAAAFLLAGVILVATGLPDQAALVTDGPVAPVVGAQAPDFAAETVAGAVVTLAELRGQIVLLNFWATWCGPCQVELPELQALVRDNPGGTVRILAINVDEPPEIFRPWAAERGLTFDLVADASRAVQARYQLRGVPQTVIIGPDGVIRAIFYGPVSLRHLQQTLDAVRSAG